MQAVRGFAAAVAFLTRVPVGRVVVLDAGDVARGGAFFPVVGAGIGAAVGGVTDVLSGPLTPTLGAVLGVALGAALTGALHLDALADSADALAKPRERALEVMRDHAIGAYGATALALDLILKVGALAALADHALRYAVCAVALARAAPLVLSAALPYARSDGLGHAAGGRRECAVALAVAAALCAWLAPWLLLALVLVPVCAAAARRWLGGYTGDVLGATAELVELAALVIAVAWRG